MNTNTTLLALIAELESQLAQKDAAIAALKRSIAAYKANSTRRKAAREAA